MTPKGGNHRGSIFRLLIGAALLARVDARGECTSWGLGNSADAETRGLERAIEERVSDYIGAMPFLWIAVDEPQGAATGRGAIERNSVSY